MGAKPEVTKFFNIGETKARNSNKKYIHMMKEKMLQLTIVLKEEGESIGRFV